MRVLPVIPVLLLLPLLAASLGDALAQPAPRMARSDRAATAIPLERSPDRAAPAAQWSAPQRPSQPKRHMPAASALRPPSDTGIVRRSRSCRASRR
jgi:hypothetical protein